MKLELDSGALPSLANRCYIVGEGRRADIVWSRGDFEALCEHMLNENPLEHFLAAWVDSNSGQARFAKNGRGRADKRCDWVWESITGKAKSKTSFGFYPSNEQQMSHWAAIDFDAHNGEHERARKWSLAAFELLLRNPGLFLVLCSSGGGGFHLFIYTREYYPVGDWIVLLKQVCAFIGAPIEDGVCEILPNERAESQRCGKGIRAPGTLNPKSGTNSLIEIETLRPLLDSLPRSWKPRVGKVNCYSPRKDALLSLHKRTKYYSSSTAGLIEQEMAKFPIERVGTRNGVLTRLVGNLFFKFGREVSQKIIEEHYNRYRANLRTDIEDHLREFGIAWSGFAKKVVESLPRESQSVYEQLTTDARREGFLLIRSFAVAASAQREDVFPIARASLADRLGLTEAGAGDVIRALIDADTIRLVDKCKPHQFSKTFKWQLGKLTSQFKRVCAPS